MTRVERRKPVTRERYAVPFIRIHARCGFRGCEYPATAVWSTFRNGRKRQQFLLCGGCSSVLFMASREPEATSFEIRLGIEGPLTADPTITLGSRDPRSRLVTP